MSTICQLHADLRYYLCMEPVDIRKQFHGLQGIINTEFGRYITQDEAFIFIGKTGTTAKILHREHGGLTPPDFSYICHVKLNRKTCRKPPPTP